MGNKERIFELARTGMLQKDIAKEVGCSSAYVSKVLVAKRSSDEMAHKRVSAPAATVRLNLQTGVAQIDCDDADSQIEAHINAKLGPEFKALLEGLMRLC